MWFVEYQIVVAMVCMLGISLCNIVKSVDPPVFFLQDLSDGKCISGDDFVRCSADTLWSVAGKPGSYQLHKETIESTDNDLCLDRKVCHLDESDVRVFSCKHCGAKSWNILGDSESGYVLTQDNNRYCLKRSMDTAIMVKCEKGYSGLSLQFPSKEDIGLMRGKGADFLYAASDNNLETVQVYLDSRIMDVNLRDWDGRTAVAAAAGGGHLEMVRYLLSRGANIALRDKDNATALMEAAQGGFLEVVELLLDGEDSSALKSLIDASTTNGVTALWLAASQGHVPIVSLLVQRGCNVNVARSDGVSALVASCSGGHLEAVVTLLTAGADVALEDKDGVTALIAAAELGHADIVNQLLQHGAEVNAMSKTGFSPLIIASAHGHVSVVEQLLTANATLELEHPEGVTPLMYAAAGGFSDVVAMLLAKGSPANTRHLQGGSALMEAATAGSVSVVDLLLAAGADPLVVDEDGVTTLMSAASQGHTDICRTLAEMGVSTNAVAKSGGTALMFAAGGGHNSTIEYLLANGADVNAVVRATPEYIEQVARIIAEGKEEVDPHKDGVSSLMLAVQGGHVSASELLLRSGASVSLRDDDDMSALGYAAKGGFKQLQLLLIQWGAEPDETYVDDKNVAHNLLMNAVSDSDIKLALALVSHGANVSFTDADGVSVVTQASYLGLVELVGVLLRAGADPLIANNEGINAVIAAASEGYAEIVSMLLLHQQNREETSFTSPVSAVNMVDKDGTSALMAAAVRGHHEAAKVLILSGADINSQNVDGHTALMFAYNGKSQVQALLEKYSSFIFSEQQTSAASNDRSGNNNKDLILEALRTHNAVVDLLLRNKADPLLKDNEGHLAADFDFHSPSTNGNVVSPASLVSDFDGSHDSRVDRDTRESRQEDGL